jgi:hypothetical protein
MAVEYIKLALHNNKTTDEIEKVKRHGADLLVAHDSSSRMQLTTVRKAHCVWSRCFLDVEFLFCLAAAVMSGPAGLSSSSSSSSRPDRSSQ